MTTIDTTRGIPPARTRARSNWKTNREALQTAQPTLLARLGAMPEGPFVVARDGFLTARPEGAWLEGCSVPLAAARHALSDATVTGTSACFILPNHAALLRAALDHLSDGQALIALIDTEQRLGWMLACADFSADLDGGRLWLCAGEGWEEDLKTLLREHPGLPTPAQFLRTPWTDEIALPRVMDIAERIFREENQSRAAWLQAHARRISAPSSPPSPPPGRICLHAPSHFRPWDDAGWTLRQLISDTWGGHLHDCDPDHPLQASPLALARRAEGCDALLTTDLARSDAPALFPLDRPWVTWVTQGRIPAPAEGAMRDRLLVADPDWITPAIARGWDGGSVRVALLPALVDPAPIEPGPVGLIVDLPDLAPPQGVREMSSQRLLWESIHRELSRDPFALPSVPERYLSHHARRHGIDPSTLEMSWWVGAIVLPSYHIGLVHQLIAAQVPLKIWGRGWEQAEQAAGCVAGPVRRREQLLDAACQCAALVHAWLTWAGHPVTRVGRELVRPVPGAGNLFLRQAVQYASGRTTYTGGVSANVLSVDLLGEALGR